MKKICSSALLLLCLLLVSAPAFAAPDISLSEGLFKNFGAAFEAVLSWFGWEAKDGSAPTPPPPPPDGTQGGPYGGCTIDPNGCPKP
jgi:hypothetical protein